MRRAISFFRIDDDNPLTGRHVLAMIGLFFGVTITVNLVMAALATGTFPGLVVKNSYVASQNYNELLAAGEAQAERGWTDEITARDGLLLVRLEDASGAALTGLDVSARIGRPASAREDRVVALRPRGDEYVAAETLPPGRWVVELAAFSNDALVYRVTRPLSVSRSGS